MHGQDDMYTDKIIGLFNMAASDNQLILSY